MDRTRLVVTALSLAIASCLLATMAREAAAWKLPSAGAILGAAQAIATSAPTAQPSQPGAPMRVNGLRKRIIVDPILVESGLDGVEGAVAMAPPAGFDGWLGKELVRTLEQSGRFLVLDEVADAPPAFGVSRLSVRIIRFALSDLTPDKLKERLAQATSESASTETNFADASDPVPPAGVTAPSKGVMKATQRLDRMKSSFDPKMKSAAVVLAVSLWGPDGTLLKEWTVSGVHQSISIQGFTVNGAGSDPISVAGRQSVSALLADLQVEMGQILWETLVAGVDWEERGRAGAILLAAGKNEGVKAGDTFDILRPGKLVKGRMMPARVIGRCHVTTLQYDSATATIELLPGQSLEEGYLVRQQGLD